MCPHFYHFWCLAFLLEDQSFHLLFHLKLRNLVFLAVMICLSLIILVFIFPKMSLYHFYSFFLSKFYHFYSWKTFLLIWNSELTASPTLSNSKILLYFSPGDHWSPWFVHLCLLPNLWNVWLLFLKICFCLICSLLIWYCLTSHWCCSLLSNIFKSLFQIGSFLWSIFKFTDFFFSYLQCGVSLSSEFFYWRYYAFQF